MDLVTKQLIEIRARWAGDKSTFRWLATTHKITWLDRASNLLNEAEIALDKAILETSAQES